jgi:CRISPR-associated protein Csx3
MKSNLKFRLYGSNNHFQILELNLKGNGLIEPSDLKNVKLPKGIDFRKGVVIYGKAPVWLFAFLSHELHIAKWVATFDPRVGAVIVQSHDSNSPQKGDIIQSEEILKYISPEIEEKKAKKPPTKNRSKVICIVGPANSGKSVFIRELRKILNKKLGEEFRNHYYTLRACPDGEGDWFGDLSAAEGKIYRTKKSFDDEFAPRIVEDLKKLKKSKKVIFVDCGGKIDRKNQMIFNESTHAIIVSSNENATLEWIGALKASELELLAEVFSRDFTVSKSAGKLKFEIGKLFREEKRVRIPARLLTQLINLTV